MQLPVVVYVIRTVAIDWPVTTPVAATTVAIDELPLFHSPPDGVLDNVVVAATHTSCIPVIGVGIIFTVTSALT